MNFIIFMYNSVLQVTFNCIHFFFNFVYFIYVIFVIHDVFNFSSYIVIMIPSSFNFSVCFKIYNCFFVLYFTFYDLFNNFVIL